MIPLPFKTFLTDIPWKQMIIGLLIAAAICFVVNYIGNAEANKNAVVQLKAGNAELAQANLDLKLAFDEQMAVIQANFAEFQKREKDYEQNNTEIDKAPDSGCARNSKPIATSLRLLKNRRHN